MLRKVGNKFGALTAALIAVIMLVSACDSSGGAAQSPAAGQSQAAQATQSAQATQGAQSEQPTSAAPVKDTITIAQSSESVSLDSHSSNDPATATVALQIYNSLVRFDSNMQIVPSLATEWKIIDDLTWEFKLREGVKWHNGETFNANDVKFSIERIKESAQVRQTAEAITEVEIVDDYTVIFKTAAPYATMLPNLAHSGARIMNEKAVTEGGDTYGTNPVGTGPYKFVEWVKGERIVLERFDEYWEGPAASKTLIFKPIPEGSSRTIALETGEIDINVDVEPVDKAKIEANPDTELVEVASNRIEYVLFNVTKAPFDNVLVRQALSYAIDPAAVLEVAEAGRGTFVKTVTGPSVFGYNADIEGFSYDPEKAKALLAEAGITDGLEVVLWASGDVRNRMAQVIQANWKEVGVNASIELLEWSAYLDRAAKGEHQTMLMGWSNITADADGGLYANFHSTKAGAGGNRSFYANEKVDELLTQGRSVIDPAERLKIYAEAQELIMEDAPWTPLYCKMLAFGVRKGLVDVEVHPGGQYSFYRVHY